jgi:hypothetical protein
MLEHHQDFPSAAAQRIYASKETQPRGWVSLFA